MSRAEAVPGTEAVAYADPGSRLAPGWQRGAFMQVFVRRWRDGDGDGIGDLAGLTQSLDYLRDLGVRGLWLMPIHPSEDDDHGYAVADYRDVHPHYGTLGDFDRLLDAAHARGIGVIIDYVINHSASTHPLFAESRKGPESPYRDWYVWRDRAPPGWKVLGHDPWWRDPSGAYFGAFSRRMPDFNWRHPAVAAWHHDNLRFWLNRGIDGFRFDACGHLVENGPDAWDCQPENYVIMAAIRRLLDRYDNRFMVCEAPGDPQGFARVAGSAFAFDLNRPLIGAARGDAAALQVVGRYFETAPHDVATLLSNQDAFAGARARDQLGGNAAALRRAAALYLLLPGTPFIYYGEEIGMPGHPVLRGDAALRQPMRWDEAARQQAAPDSLRAFYRRLLALRHGRRSLMAGDYTIERVDGAMLAFRRREDGEETLVVVGATVDRTGARELFVDRAAGVAVYDLSPSSM